MGPVGRSRDGRALLKVHLQPRSSKNQVSGLHDNALKLSVSAPPVDGKANKAVIDYLAELFAVSKGSITLISGGRSRKKIFCFDTLTEENLQDRLQEILAA